MIAALLTRWRRHRGATAREDAVHIAWAEGLLDPDAPIPYTLTQP